MRELQFEQFLPITLEDAWSFFSNPGNLNIITPEKLNFKTLTEVPTNMEDGLIIRYSIKPMMSIPMGWTTRIHSIKPHAMFIDEQIKGPYKTWIHEHHFLSFNNGVMMHDKLKYDIGWGFIGKIAGMLWVDKKVKQIFEYRRAKLNEIFEADPD